MKIIGLNTSPRKGSNVRFAIEEALNAAKDNGAQVELIDTNKLNISPCQGDNYCKAHEGKCAIDDDMTQIYEKILEADRIILGSPIYFLDVNAQAKLIIDRLYAFFMEESLKDVLSAKKLSIITTNGTVEKEVILPVLNILAEGFKFLGFDIVDVEILGDNNVPNSIKDKQDQIEIARKVGENIIK